MEIIKGGDLHNKILNWNPCLTYQKDDLINFNGYIFKSLADYNNWHPNFRHAWKRLTKKEIKNISFYNDNSVQKKLLTWHGIPVDSYQSFKTYAEGDLVEFNGDIFKSLHSQNTNNPIYKSSWKQLTRNAIEIVEEWKADKLYTRYDKVKYKGSIYVCEANRLNGSTPPPESLWWKMWGNVNDDLDEKPTTIKVNNDRTGDITADNVVIYGNHTGNISANGEKSVVVIFGDVTGDITANQVIRLDNSDSKAVKAMFLDKQGQTQTCHDELQESKECLM